MPREIWPVIAAHWSRPAFYAGLGEHIQSIPATVEEMHAAEPIFGIPILVLTPAAIAPLDTDALRSIGECAQQKIAFSSGHWVHLDEPELVIESIREMIQTAASVRLAAPAPLPLARE
jgi:pimeloyl-ACP methyl ester carboxylesterase